MSFPGIYPGVTTNELDNLAAEISATMATIHPDYAKLAGRIAVSNLHKESQKTFSTVIEMLYTHCDKDTGKIQWKRLIGRRINKIFG